MNPISSDIFGRLAWLTKWVKNLLGRVYILEQSGAGSYKVYTALLTQSGGDDIQSTDTGTLTIGITYRIANPSPGMDFTNVGAPNNEINTYFVATGTTPASWGSIENTGNSTLEFNNGAPVVTVLENTIGNIWFTYEGVGNYLIHLPSAIYSKTICFATSNDSAQNYSVGFFSIGSYINGSVNISQFDLTGSAFDNFFQAIEIRVY